MIPAPTFQEWTEADEQALVVGLEETVEIEGSIVLEDTDYGRLDRQHQHECMASVADMSAEQIAALEQMIAACNERTSQHWWWATSARDLLIFKAQHEVSTKNELFVGSRRYLSPIGQDSELSVTN
eukprot:scaffold196575_cov51-Attheya_sp.AAC.1